MSLTQNGARTHRIASIPGDGIGIEVIEQAIKVLRTIEALFNSFTFDIDTLDWSSKRYLEQGEYIPADGWQRLKVSDAILFGAVGSPGMCSFKKGGDFQSREVTYLTMFSILDVPDDISLWNLILPLRKKVVTLGQSFRTSS